MMMHIQSMSLCVSKMMGSTKYSDASRERVWHMTKHVGRQIVGRQCTLPWVSFSGLPLNKLKLYRDTNGGFLRMARLNDTSNS